MSDSAGDNDRPAGEESAGCGSPRSPAADGQPPKRDGHDPSVTARRKRKAKSERERRERLRVARLLAAGVVQPPEAQQAAEVLRATRRLLDAIASADFDTYKELCDQDLSCFEPEARGALVEGLGFHRFYFDLHSRRSPGAASQQTIASHHVKMLGDSAAVIAYTRLQQTLDEAGRPVTKTSEETRVWHHVDGKWKNVHFHRSLPTTE